jgi:hypothetical protein
MLTHYRDLVHHRNYVRIQVGEYNVRMRLSVSPDTPSKLVWTCNDVTRPSIPAAGPPTAIGRVSGSGGIIDTGTVGCRGKVRNVEAFKLLHPRHDLFGCWGEDDKAAIKTHEPDSAYSCQAFCLEQASWLGRTRLHCK